MARTGRYRSHGQSARPGRRRAPRADAGGAPSGSPSVSMSGAGIALRWSTPPSVIAAGLRTYDERLGDAVFELAEVFAMRTEADAKASAPWTDRTGNARQGLTGAAERVSATVVRIVLFHKADYGKWLEVRWAGRYAVIMPTLQRSVAPLMAALRRLVNG